MFSKVAVYLLICLYGVSLLYPAYTDLRAKEKSQHILLSMDSFGPKTRSSDLYGDKHFKH